MSRPIIVRLCTVSGAHYRNQIEWSLIKHILSVTRVPSKANVPRKGGGQHTRDKLWLIGRREDSSLKIPARQDKTIFYHLGGYFVQTMVIAILPILARSEQ